MKKVEIYEILKIVESKFAILPFLNMSELVTYYQELAELYSFNVSDYVIEKSEVFNEKSENGEVTTTSIFLKHKLVGIDTVMTIHFTLFRCANYSQIKFLDKIFQFK